MGVVAPQAPPMGRITPAKCAYCGRYGALGACEGCGAPNQPAVQPTTPGFCGTYHASKIVAFNGGAKYPPLTMGHD